LLSLSLLPISTFFEGVEAVLGERVKMFTEPLYVDEKKLYANSSSNVQETPSEASATSGSAVTAA
jgi:hypothetical protein